MTAPEAADAEPAIGRTRMGRIVGAGLVILALIIAGNRLAPLVQSATVAVQEAGPWGPPAFVLLYATATIAFVPGSLLTLAAGAVYGVGRGTAYVVAGATLGEAGAFLIARYLARETVARHIAASRRFAAIDAALAEQGWRVVLLLRLSPVIPFNLLNYALGVSRVRFRDFMIASIGIVPGTLLYVSYGRVAGELIAVGSGAATPRGPATYALLAIGLAATLGATALIARAARRALTTAAGRASE